MDDDSDRDDSVVGVRILLDDGVGCNAKSQMPRAVLTYLLLVPTYVCILGNRSGSLNTKPSGSFNTKPDGSLNMEPNGSHDTKPGGSLNTKPGGSTIYFRFSSGLTVR